jgi:hypothetical protein
MQALVSAIIGALFGAIGAYIKMRLEVKKMQDTFNLKVQEIDETSKQRIKEMKQQLKLQHDLEREKEYATSCPVRESTEECYYCSQRENSRN